MFKEVDDLKFLLNKAARLTAHHFNTKLKEFDITLPQFGILLCLYDYERSYGMKDYLTPANIAEFLSADRPTVSGVIYRLSQKGLVLSAINPNDRRSQIIRLTDKARKIIPYMKQLGDESIKEATEGLKKDEIEQLKIYLAKIVHNLTN
ncbi:MAG: MarR family transcriptional regulator [Bacillota bacterium]